MKLPPILYTISRELDAKDAKAILVGGSVRDHFLGLTIKDYDIEVYGLRSIEVLETILRQYGKVKLVGKSFGVLKFIYEGEEYDFSFPRVEKKIGKGHRGFQVTIDGEMDYQSAAKRRDFTINAIGYDILEDCFLDPFGGRDDLKKKILRHIDDKTFVEDPLRVYRGVQFCARFRLSMHSKTKLLCQKMIDRGFLDELPKERIFEEIKKLLLKAEKPSLGFDLLKELRVLRYYPPLENLSKSRWIHTLARLDCMVSLKDKDEKHALILMLGALCLDLGTVKSRELILSLSDEVKLLKSILPLVKYAQKVSQIYKGKDSDTAIRILSTNVIIEDLVLVVKADFLAQNGIKDKYDVAEWLKNEAKRLGVLQKPPQPLLFGRDLVKELGLKPSPKFKEILDRVYLLQLEGKIDTKEKALSYIRKGEI